MAKRASEAKVAAIRDVLDAEALLRAKGDALRAIAAIEAGLNAEIARLKAACAKQCAAHVEVVASADKALEAWFRATRGPDEKSRKLTFGVLRLRASRFVKLLRSEATVIERLATGFAQFLRQPPPEIDKQALLKAAASDAATTATLRKLGVDFGVRETFSADVDETAIAAHDARERRAS